MRERKRQNKRQQDFLEYLDNEYNTDPDNIYPDGMSDKAFRRLITEYLLGSDYYIADPVSPAQANVYIAAEIIAKYKSKNTNK